MACQKSVYENVFDYPEYPSYHSAIQMRDWETALKLNGVLTIRAVVDWSKTESEMKMMRGEQVRALRASSLNLQELIKNRTKEMVANN